MAQHEETTILRFSCACRKVHGSATVPTSKLPLPFDICHCSICRHQSGLLCASYLTLPEGCLDVNFHGALGNYKSSETVTRTFCNNCGANIYVQDSNEPRPDICTGTLEKAEGIIKIRSHIFLSDSEDGGLGPWIPDVPAWEGFSKRSKQIKISQRPKSIASNDRKSTVHANCLCKGVDFVITPPNSSSRDLVAPYPDLLRPYIDGKTVVNKGQSKWWLCADDQKYLAGTCSCHSCRLSSGFDIQVWAFIPKVNILQLDGGPFNSKIGTLKQYESSKGTHRHFCGTCGATVFWRADDRPDLIDISVGLLNADGARAEAWLEWNTERVSFEEEAQHKDLIAKLGVCLRTWGKTTT